MFSEPGQGVYLVPAFSMAAKLSPLGDFLSLIAVVESIYRSQYSVFMPYKTLNNSVLGGICVCDGILIANKGAATKKSNGVKVCFSIK
jgi:hypothetical protein